MEEKKDKYALTKALNNLDYYRDDVKSGIIKEDKEHTKKLLAIIKQLRDEGYEEIPFTIVW